MDFPEFLIMDNYTHSQVQRNARVRLLSNNDNNTDHLIIFCGVVFFYSFLCYLKLLLSFQMMASTLDSDQTKDVSVFGVS